MEINMIYIETAAADEIEVNPREVLRYAGFGKSEPEPQMERQIAAVTQEMASALSCRACFTPCGVTVKAPFLDFGLFQTESAALSKNLRGCGRVILFGATIGAATDRIIAKYSRLSPSSALIAQAVGAAAIESWCDLFCRRLQEKFAKEGFFLRPRFSPGYGDFALLCQRDIFRILDCPRQIGVSLTESCMMTPSKSVSAVIGISRENLRCVSVGCEECSKRKTCEYSRG